MTEPARGRPGQASKTIAARHLLGVAGGSTDGSTSLSTTVASTPEPGSMLSIALGWAARGWHVFPLIEGGKTPAGGLVPRGHTEATTDPATISRWWTERPAANVGVHCKPSGLVGVDLDVKHGVDGVAAWPEVAARADGGALPDPTMTVRTASGGLHLIYACDYTGDAGDLTNSQGDLAPGIDTRSNGYLVAPGSIVDGRRYAIVSPPEVGPAPMPPWLPGALRAARARPARPESERPRLGAIAESPAVLQRVRQLATELADAPIGVGNATAARVAWMAGGYVGAGQITSDQAVEILSGSVSGWSWDNAQDERAMMRTIRRQVEAGADHPRPWVTSLDQSWGANGSRAAGIDVPASLGQPGGASGAEGEAVDPFEARVRDELLRLRAREEATRRLRAASAETLEDRIARLEAATLTSADLDLLPPQEWLVDGWLPRGGLCLLVGASGCYKSFLAVDLAVRVALGQPWFGWATQAGPVLYVAAEGAAGLKVRIREAEVARGSAKPVEGLSVHPLPVQLGGDDWAAFVEVTRRRSAALVIIDTLNRTTVGREENSNSEMRDVAEAAADLARETGATVLLVHHAGHEQGRARGASAIPAAADATMSVRRTADMRMTVSTRREDGGKAKDGEERTANLKVRVGPLGASLVVANLEEVDAEATRPTCREAMTAILRDEAQRRAPDAPAWGRTRAEALAMVTKGTAALRADLAGEGYSRAAARKAWDALIEAEEIVRMGDSQRFILAEIA